MKPGVLIRAAILAAALAAAAGPAHAAGYSLYEQGARALGMAGAFTARVDDPSAMFFNPAGLASLDGKELLISPSLILFQADFAGVAPYPGYGVTEETEDKQFPPVAAYYAQGIGRKFAAGVGVMNPYGLEVEWKNPDQYTGRYISTRSSLKPFFFTPTVAWAPSTTLRLGLGGSLVLSHVELERHLSAYNPIDDRTEDVGTAVLKSETGFGAGWNAGVQWSPAKWRFGATYRSQIDVDYNGQADFTQTPTGNAAFDQVVTGTFPPDQPISTSVPFPAQGSLGVAYVPCESWAFEGDFNFTWWSEFDHLDISFSQTPALDLAVNENWDDAVNVRVGAEYRKGGVSPWSWRAGYYFDQSPQPVESVGPLLPDADRHGVSAGLGWQNASIAVDGYALYLIAPDRSTEGKNRDDYNGTYSINTFVAGVSLGLHFH